MLHARVRALVVVSISLALGACLGVSHAAHADGSGGATPIGVTGCLVGQPVMILATPGWVAGQCNGAPLDGAGTAAAVTYTVPGGQQSTAYGVPLCSSTAVLGCWAFPAP